MVSAFSVMPFNTDLTFFRSPVTDDGVTRITASGATDKVSPTSPPTFQPDAKASDGISPAFQPAETASSDNFQPVANASSDNSPAPSLEDGG